MSRNKNRNKILKSEYTNSYKTYRDLAEAEYSSNLKLRLARRSQEVSHQPWAWVSESSSENDITDTETDSNIIVNKDEAIQVNRSNSYQKHIKDDYTTSDDTDSNFDASGTIDLNTNNNHNDMIERLKRKALAKAAQLRKLNSNGNHKTTDTNNVTDKSVSTQTSNYSRPHHPIKGVPKQEKQINKFQPKSSESMPRASKSCVNIRRNNHFIPYGLGSRTDENYHKKTFNVSANCDVYPSAVRASQKRETDRLQKVQDRQSQLQQQQQLNLQTKGPRFVGRNNGKSGNRMKCRSASSVKSVANGLGCRNDSEFDWLSEYQSRFPIYDNEIYRRCRANIAEKGIASRQETPRTCRI